MPGRTGVAQASRAASATGWRRLRYSCHRDGAAGSGVSLLHMPAALSTGRGPRRAAPLRGGAVQGEPHAVRDESRLFEGARSRASRVRSGTSRADRDGHGPGRARAGTGAGRDGRGPGRARTGTGTGRDGRGVVTDGGGPVVPGRMKRAVPKSAHPGPG
ncbi:hypothetical protein Ate01nite_28070 [Actinoplanes teichomyceticus]|nr:hypothetical protein Ate01nite_28070 [Actinoplanes teichomyceticus]